jgi:CO/xanthine dehydrogenase Mo-binding subunit
MLVDTLNGEYKVVRVDILHDAGKSLHPAIDLGKIEGGCIQSTSWTLREAVAFDANRITTRSWADYPILRMSEVPAVDVQLIDRPDERPLGVGEGSQGPTAAAIANAFANATGRRVRDIPFTAERVKAALG